MSLAEEDEDSCDLMFFLIKVVQFDLVGCGSVIHRKMFDRKICD